MPVNPNKEQAKVDAYEEKSLVLTASSDLYVKSYVEGYRCSVRNIVVAGDPLCDELLSAPQNVYDFSRFVVPDIEGYDKRH